MTVHHPSLVQFESLDWSSGGYPQDWHSMHTFKEWWINCIQMRGGSRKAMALLAILVPWEILKQRKFTTAYIELEE
jgi:hypothetical protein